MPDSQTAAERETVRRPLFANVLYPRFRKAAEEHGEHEYRERLLDGLTGRVLELGCGDGAHFRLYPETSMSWSRSSRRRT
jgi:hypothetical protein